MVVCLQIMAESSTYREILACHVTAGALGGTIGGLVLREGMQQEKPSLIAIGAVTTLAVAAMTGVGIIRRPRPEPTFMPIAPDAIPGGLVLNDTDL